MQWTVDSGRLDSGGGLMTNKKKVLHLRAMAMCLWVPYLRWVTHEGGRGKVPLVRKLNSLKKFSARVPEFKTFFKNSRFSFFLNPSFPPESTMAILLPPNDFLKMAGCLRTHRLLSLFLVFEARRIPPRPVRWGMQHHHPQRACRGLVGFPGRKNLLRL